MDVDCFLVENCCETVWEFTVGQTHLNVVSVTFFWVVPANSFSLVVPDTVSTTDVNIPAFDCIWVSELVFSPLLSKYILSELESIVAMVLSLDFILEVLSGVAEIEKNGPN